MDAFVIEGPTKLRGTVSVSGSKNATLPLIFLSILSDRPLTITHVPRLWDIDTALKILTRMGCHTAWDKVNAVVCIEPHIRHSLASYDLVRTMRAGVLALGPLIAKTGQAKVSLPGGCAIGARPVNLHLEALSRFGVDLRIEEGYIMARAKRLIGAKITFPQVTVTGTQNALFVASVARGESRIENAACEPEVVCLGEELIRSGVAIEGLGTSKVRIQGNSSLTVPAEIQAPSDRIEAGTWIAVSAVTQSPLTITDVRPLDLQSVLQVFQEMGVEIDVYENSLQVRPPDHKSLRPIRLETAPYPGFPTDMQAQLLACLCFAQGDSEICETIFENRFMHVAELRRLGANIKVMGNTARVYGPTPLRGAPIMATDLRASASLVLAALGASGVTKVSRIYHLDRGYQRLDEKLRAVGAFIQRVSESS